MSDSDITLVRDAITAFNSAGVEAALGYVADDVEWIGPPDWLEDRLYEGHDGLRRLAALWTELFDDYRLDIDQLIDAGDVVVALLHQRGRMKESGDAIEQPVAYTWENRDGKASRIHVYFSWDEALRAAGVEGATRE